MEASESLSCENNNISLFSALPESSNMYSNKDSNLISDLRDKYGENSVSLFRKWENTTKKMVTTGIIGGSHSNALRPVLLLLVVKSKPPLFQI